MPFHPSPSLKNYPFIRLVTALAIGISICWYFRPPVELIVILLAFIICLLVYFSLLSHPKEFTLRWARGWLILLLFVCTGMLLTWKQNIQNNADWFGNTYQPGNAVLITIEEPLEEKARSFKAL